MRTMHHHHPHHIGSMHRMHSYSQRPSLLEIAQLANFDAALGDATDEELRRKRIAYIRDAVQQMQVGASFLKGFGCLMIPFVIIPLFWPFVGFFWFVRKKSLSLMASQLSSALDYWGLRHSDIA